MSGIRPIFALVLLLAAAGTTEARNSGDAPPPREIRLVEKPQDQLSLQEVDDFGKIAFNIDPRKWKHAESENFVLHFRRATEARRVIREIEYTLWYTAQALGKSKADYLKKSHVFIFSGSGDWRSFLSETGVSSWAASFAYGDDLYLNIGGAVEKFDSDILAHEVAHAAVSRLYPGKRWPLWLNEGFAEYIGSASIASRRGQSLASLQKKLGGNLLTLEQLVAIPKYPADLNEVPRLYRSSERAVRYMMTRYPQDRFPKFVDALLEGQELEAAVTSVYGDLVADYATFRRECNAF